MPASAIVMVRSLSPCLSFIGSWSARSSAAFRSGAIGFGLRLRPLGLPLCPGLNRYSFGGRPGPSLYSGSDVCVGTALAWRFLLLCSDIALFFFILCDHAAALARCSVVVSKVSPDPARVADLPV